MILPGDCKSIDEIRNEIDQIDKQIIDLLGNRFSYIKEIVKFKRNEEEVAAPLRYENVIQKRRNWASEKDLNPDVVEKIYKILMDYFIEEQMNILNKK